MKTINRLGRRFVCLSTALILASVATCPLPAATDTADDCLVYVGTYTGTKSKGIYMMRMNPQTGQLGTPVLAAETPNPSFLAVHPDHRALYAANRLLLATNEVGTFAGQRNNGAVTAYAIEPETGKLTEINQQPSGGGGPCHLIVDAAGRHVLVANYGGGSVSVLPIQEGGRLGVATAFIQHAGSSVNKQRQEGPHAHGIYLDAANRFAFVPDLGLDKIMSYRFDPAKGTLAANDPPWAATKPGAGPRHFAFHPEGRFAYVINELDSTITAFAFDAQHGVLKELQSLPTLPSDFTGPNTTAEVEVHPNGKFLYGSNRGHDSIAVFAIDGTTGRLAFVEHQATRGMTPRNFGIHPDGRFLLAANQGTDNVVVFRIDPETGRLQPTGQSVEIGAPVCVKFVPAGKPTK